MNNISKTIYDLLNQTYEDGYSTFRKDLSCEIKKEKFLPANSPYKEGWNDAIDFVIKVLEKLEEA